MKLEVDNFSTFTLLRLKKESSWTGDLPSPTMSNRHRKDAGRHNVSLSRLKQTPFSFTPQVTDSTEFLIPGLDVKVDLNRKGESSLHKVSPLLCLLMTNHLYLAAL